MNKTTLCSPLKIPSKVITSILMHFPMIPAIANAIMYSLNHSFSHSANFDYFYMNFVDSRDAKMKKA